MTKFHTQAIVLGISIEDVEVFMKYMGGFAEYIQRELELFKVSTIDEATVKAIAIEAKNKKSDRFEVKQKDRGRVESDGSSKGESSQKELGNARSYFCDHCRKTCHKKEWCWELHPEKQPDKKKAVLNTHGVEEISGIQEPDILLSLMAKTAETSQSSELREGLFHLEIQVKQCLIEAIVDPGCQRNLFFECMVQKMGLETIAHPRPYPLGWIQKDVEMKVTKQCTFKFAITGRYIDEVTCEVVPLDVCQVILGSPYLWDRDAIHYMR